MNLLTALLNRTNMPGHHISVVRAGLSGLVLALAGCGDSQPPAPELSFEEQLQQQLIEAQT